MARGQGFSYTAVHDLFTKTVTEPPRLPVLHKVVERLATMAPRTNVEETLDRFDALWRAAAEEPFEEPSPAAELNVERNPSGGTQALTIDETAAMSVRVPLIQPGGVPIGSSSVVVGRQELVQWLRSAWEQQQWPGQRIIVLHGRGGAGKSTAAWLAASRPPAEVSAWWVTATSREQLRGQLRQVALEAGGSESQVQLAWSGQRDPADLLYELLRAYRKPWLLVIDDANDVDLLSNGSGPVFAGRGWLRPPPPHGLIVVTSRDGSPDVWGGGCLLRSVGRLSEDEAAELLLTLAPVAGALREARSLAERLDGLPLALRLAGIYLRLARDSGLPGAPTTFSGYQKAYEEAISDPDAEVDDYLADIQQSANVSLRLLDQNSHHDARTLLRILAHFALAPIRVAWLRAEVLRTHPDLSRLTVRRLMVMLNSLERFALIDWSTKGLLLHQEIRDVTRGPERGNRYWSGQQDRYWSIVIDILDAALPVDTEPNDSASWAFADAVAPHALYLLSIVEGGNLTRTAVATLSKVAFRTTRCLLTAGTVGPQRGEELLRNLLSIQQIVLGYDNRVTLQTRHSLAVLLYERGDLVGAQGEYRAILKSQRRLFGEDDRDTLRTRSTLVFLLHDLEDVDGAVEESESVLTVQRRLFGDHDRDTLLTWDRYALVLTRSDRLEAAQQQFEAILAIRLRAFGGDDRETLITQHGIANLLRRLDDLRGAQDQLEAVLKVRRRLFGDDDRHTLRTRFDLATLLKNRGELGKARAELEEVLEAQQRLFGDQDWDTRLTQDALSNFNDPSWDSEDRYR